MRAVCGYPDVEGAGSEIHKVAGTRRNRKILQHSLIFCNKNGTEAGTKSKSCHCPPSHHFIKMITCSPRNKSRN